MGWRGALYRLLVPKSIEHQLQRKYQLSDEEIFVRYHRWYYNRRIWRSTTYLGIECQKWLGDLWNYQEILFNLKPSLVIEFGTHRGGSSLYFSDILQHVSPHSRVLTVDPDFGSIDAEVKENEHIEVLTSSSTEEIVAERIRQIRQEYSGPVFAILDSDHTKEHVLAEMKLLRPLLQSGDYLVVEDSNINGHPVRPEWGEGPMEAIQAYEQEYPDDYIHDVERENRFGLTFAPYGYLIRR